MPSADCTACTWSDDGEDAVQAGNVHATLSGHGVIVDGEMF